MNQLYLQHTFMHIVHVCSVAYNMFVVSKLVNHSSAGMASLGYDGTQRPGASQISSHHNILYQPRHYNGYLKFGSKLLSSRHSTY